MKNKKNNCPVLDKLEKDLKEHGWQVVMIEATSYLPSFAYTVGLWENYKHPELIAFGLPINLMHIILNDAANIVKSGGIIETDKKYEDFLQDYLTIFIQVDPKSIKDYFGAAIERYKSLKFPAYQFVWPDKSHRFPWEKNFEERYKALQPLLDRNANFKFNEERSLGIFTTRQWLEKDAPIVEVLHDQEGDWQFLTKDWDEEGIILVTLEEMIKKDDSLNELFNLDYGQGAIRETETSNWERYNIDLEE